MASHRGGETARAGFYWSPGEWRMVTIEKEGARLPGPAEERFVRLPTVAMLVLAPVMGGLFVMFLPFIGFAIVARYLAREGMAAARRRSLRVHPRRPRARAKLETKPGTEHLRKAS